MSRASVPGTFLSFLHVFTYLKFVTALWGANYYYYVTNYPYNFTDENVKAQRSNATKIVKGRAGLWSQTMCYERPHCVASSHGWRLHMPSVI